MRLYSTFLLFLIAMLLLVTSCNEYEDNGKFTYMPETISMIDSAGIRLTTRFEYDANNRIVSIADTISGNVAREDSAYTRTQIQFGGEGNITGMVSQCYNTKTQALIRTLNTTYTYSGNDILAVTTTSGEGTDANYKMELNNNRQVVKYTWDNIRKSAEYEYDGRGNRTTGVVKDKDGIIYNYAYNYDDRRGIFKHVNMPNWFIANELNKSRSTVWISMNENINAVNNFTSIYWENPLDTIPVMKVLTSCAYSYNSFGYPLQMSDNHRFSGRITYVRTK